jgi:hypothetical protein
VVVVVVVVVVLLMVPVLLVVVLIGIIGIVGIPQAVGVVVVVVHSISVVVAHFGLVNEDDRGSRKWSDSNVEYGRDNLPRDRQMSYLYTCQFLKFVP